MKKRILNVKSVMFLFVSILLICGMSDLSYGQACEVGDVIYPGESCEIPGTKNCLFSVLPDGSSVYQEAGGLQLDYDEGAHCGDFVANKQADGTWLIETVPDASVRSTPSNLPRQMIYWLEYSVPPVGMRRMNSDGSNREFLFPAAPVPGHSIPSIRVDPTGRKIYWMDVVRTLVNGNRTNKMTILRSNFDGSNVETVVEDLMDISTFVLQLDVAAGKMYWIGRTRKDRTTSRGGKYGDAYGVLRANLDGSNVEVLPAFGMNFELNLVGRKIYQWSWHPEGATQPGDRTYLFKPGYLTIVWANLDEALEYRKKLEKLQKAAVSMYVAHFSAGRKQYNRIRTDKPFYHVDFIGVDVASEKIYGVESIPNAEETAYTKQEILRLNLDGTHVETIAELSLDAQNFKLDTVEGKIYWIDKGGQRHIIKRMNLDGSNIEGVIHGRWIANYGFHLTPDSLTALGFDHTSLRTDLVASPKPDLAVESFQPSNPTLVPGESFTLSGIVRNKGEGESSPTTLRYYFSTKERITLTDTAIGETDVPSLASDATSDASLVLTAPTAVGTYYYYACVPGASGEQIFDNNCTPPIKVPVKLESDLAFKSFVTNIKTEDNTLEPGASLRLAVIATNRGKGKASPTTLRYYRSTDEAFTADDIEVGKTDLPSLAVGSIKRHHVLINAPTTPGIYYYGACIDTVGEERITDNNCAAAIKVSVKAKYELSVESLQASSNRLALGESFNLSVTVRNRGEKKAPVTTLRYYRSSDETVTNTDTEVDETDINSLASDATSDANLTLTAPSEPGVYYYGACIGSANNCTPTVKITVVKEAVALIPKAQRPPLYWLDSQAGTLHRLIGGKVEALLPNVQNATSLAVDVVNGKLYWAERVDNRTGRIRTANLNGSNVKLVKDLTSVPLDIVVDPAGGKLYVINAWGKVQRMNLDGTKFEPNLIVDLEAPQHLTLDVARGKVYWTEQTGEIRRANLDGSDVELIKELTSVVLGMAADVKNGKLYVTNVLGKIQHLSFDGSNFRPNFIVDLESPGAIAVDAVDGKVYWMETERLRRANLKGGNVEDVVRGLEGMPSGITLGIPTPQPKPTTPTTPPQTETAAVVITEVPRSPLYWIDTGSGRLHRIADDQIETLVPNVRNATSLAVDVAGAKLYWAEKTGDKTGRIRRANLDGTDVQQIKDLTSVPYGIALDTANGKLYLTNAWGKVQRLNFNGSNFEPNLITGLDMPKHLTLDVSGGKVYWTEMSGGIRRANLDGSNIQEVATQVGTPMDIAVSNSNVYWTVKTGEDTGEIRFTNLHGAPNVLTLTTFTHGFPVGIAVDSVEEKVYWTTSGGEIGSANLDGSDSQPELVTGLTAPGSLAVAVKPKEILPTDAVLSITPSPVASPAIGEQLTLSLNITGGEVVVGYQVTLAFDATALRYVESSTGDYLPEGASFDPPVVNGNRVAFASTALAGVSNSDGTLATITFEVLAAKASTLTLSEPLLSDPQGNTFRPRLEAGEITEPPKPKEDVNDDGIVNIQDLVLVASGFGQTGENAADVNADGIVNIQDLVLVAGAFGSEVAAAPTSHLQTIEGFTASDVQHLLTQAREMSLTDPAYLRGIAVLEQLLASLLPKETALLPNYPNPFNPETWIPYQLAKPADVAVRIYDVNGVLVRTLTLGHQLAGIYENRSRAAYWDGRNALGEKVASGIYFYTLSAGDFTATRKMLIVK